MFDHFLAFLFIAGVISLIAGVALGMFTYGAPLYAFMIVFGIIVGIVAVFMANN